MLAAQKKSKFIVVAMIAIAVISLAFSAGAASNPVVSTLAPLEKGLQTPLKMALDTNGDLYVADPRSGGVVQLDQYGAVKQVIATPAIVTGVAILDPLTSNIAGGKLLIAMGSRVAVYDQSNVEITTLESGALPPATSFGSATGIAVDASGNIYVVDAAAKNVKKFNSAGAFDSSFGTFTQPTAIAVVSIAGRQQIAVVDTMLGNVKFFSTAGVYEKTVGAAGDLSPLAFRYPVAVAFENKSGVADRMYVLDAYHGYIQAVDVSAEPAVFLANIGSYGFAAGQLLTPSDMIFDQVNKRVLVSNGMSNVVSFGIDGGSNPANLTPPVLTVGQAQITVDVPSVTISGTVDAGAKITSSVNTSALTSAASFPSASSWMLAVSNLVAGVNTVSVTATNQFGVSTTKTVVVSYVPVTVQLTIDSYATLTGQAVVALTGTTEAGSVVTVYNDATKITNQASVIDGTWIYPASLVEGANNLTVTSTKAAKASAKIDLTIALDTKAPQLVASLLSDGSTSSSQVLSVSGTVSDAHPASLTVNGAPVAVAAGQFNTAITLNLGKNSVAIDAVDQLGNISSDVRVISFDPSFPQLTVASPVDGLVTNSQDVVVNVASDVTSVLVNGTPAVPGSQAGDFAASVKLSAGLNTILVTAVDQYGRTVQEKRTVTYDAVAPVVSITTPSQDLATRVPGVSISGTLSDNTAISGISATVNGADVPLTLTNDSFTIFAEMAKEGVYAVAITVTDAAHNSSTAFRTILYDVTPPVVAVDAVISPLPVALSGTVEQGSAVVVSDSAALKFYAVVSNSSWTADLANMNYDAKALVVTATDAAGNASVKAISIPVPDGDVDGDGVVTIKDALRLIKLVVSNTAPTQNDLNHGDVGPLLGGKRNPNGKLDLNDGILILRKALGLSAWL